MSKRKDLTHMIAFISTIGCIYFYFYGGNCDHKHGTSNIQKSARLSIQSPPTHELKPEVNPNKDLLTFKNKVSKEDIVDPEEDVKTLPLSTSTTEKVELETTVRTRRQSFKPVDMKNGQEYLLEQHLNPDWPRVNIHDCKKMEFMNKGINSPPDIGNKAYPRTGIVSFPGSGNTWARHLLQQATGLYTGSVYVDKSLLAGGFLGETEDCMDNSTVAIKAHYPPNNVAQYHCKFDRIILILRDPYRALLAEFNWRATGQHTGNADPRLYRTRIWKEHVINRSQLWSTTTKIWLQRFVGEKKLANESEDAFTVPATRSKTLLMVSFHRLKENAVREMTRIMEFLDLPAFRRQCIQEDATGKFHRTSKSRSLSEVACKYQRFELIDAVQEQIDRLKTMAQNMGLGDISSAFEGVNKADIKDCV